MKYEVTKDPSIFEGEYLKLQEADSLPIYFLLKKQIGVIRMKMDNTSCQKELDINMQYVVQI